MKLDRQSDLPGYELYLENVCRERGEVLFVGLHVVDSDNNVGRNLEQH